MPRTPTTAAKTATTTKQTPAQRAREAGKVTGERLRAAEQTEHPLMYLPIDQVIPSPDNPRLELTDLQDLQHSIRQHGVLEPLVVGAPISHAGELDADTYPLIFGHRRLAAARLAGVKTVPAVVRADLNADKATVQRLVENLQRVDLTPLEEARGYAALRNRHKMKQVDIAQAVGRNQGHISKRLALLSLPEAIAVRAGRPIDKGGIPLDVAIDASKLPGAAQVDLVDASHADDDDAWIGADRFAMAIRSTAHNAERDAHRKAALGKLRKAKVTVLNADGDTITAPPSYDDVNGPAPVWRIVDDADDVAAHAKMPCNAAVITDHPTHNVGLDDGDLRYVQLVCTDPASHATGAPATTTTKRRQTKAEKELADREAALDSAAIARGDFVRDLLASGKLPAGPTQAFLQRSMLVSTIDPDGLGNYDPAACAAMVGTPADQPPGVATLAAFAGGDRLLRYLVAAAAVNAEGSTRSVLSHAAGVRGMAPWQGEQISARLYLGWLVDCGYQLVAGVEDVVPVDDIGADLLTALLIEAGDLPAPDEPAEADAPADTAPPVDNRVACPDCQGVGRVGDAQIELCGTCEGYGVVDPPPVAATG
jgi:ParB/RepB/Spo0J family partition protein